MTVSGSLILPKLEELCATPPFLKTLYQTTQSNQDIDPIWEGVAVVFNEGAEHYLNAEKSNSSWVRLQSEYMKAGGLDMISSYLFFIFICSHKIYVTRMHSQKVPYFCLTKKDLKMSI